MRLALRILAVVSMLLSVIAAGVTIWTFQAQLPDTDPRQFLFLLAGVAAVPVGFATGIVALVASAERRQFVWLIGLCVAGLFIVVGPVVVALLSPLYAPTLPAICNGGSPTGPPPPGECQFVGLDLILANLPTVLVMATPFVIGVVALAYSARMRDPSA